MSNRPYDTLEAARNLEATGIERAQAEAIARAIGPGGGESATRGAIARLEERAATKDDVARLEERAATKDDVARLGERAATKDDIARLEARSATKDDVARLEAQIATKADRGEIYRALWVQGAGIVAILAALEFLP